MIQQSGLTLAYLGDAYFELAIRKHLIEKGHTKVNDLHQYAIQFTSANGQAKIIHKLLESELTEFEVDTFKRGRNATSTHKPKNADLTIYRAATGFECLLGHLYLDGRLDRLEFLIQKSIEIIEELRNNS